ncbi:cytochrome b-c1 complex subunit 10 [Varanus komodoensis]|uniref:cytochrome b-c1 complex subunit 10 n=1 Tax=Varanus komodoensis TaxID=61221 RepID=UPI001CF7E0B4|nr:cytochrome b-c1 complex subunit 10 [Varanus komodoensis]
MLSKLVAPRYRQQLRNWMPSMATWCSVGVVGMIWVTDWKLILNYVPWINGKFRTDN